MMIMWRWMKHEYVTLICTNYLIKFTCQPVSPTLTYIYIYIYIETLMLTIIEH